jgi:glycosyltransferase involved in cell wall biosynthesis
MAHVVIADRTLAYDGRDLAQRPLGGTETSVIHLAEALARRGHEVTCRTNCRERVHHRGVTWDPLGAGAPERCDLLLAVQQPDLLDCVRRPRHRALWVIWPPHNLRTGLQPLRMWRRRPQTVLVSASQERLYGRLVPRGRRRVVIPLGLADAVRGRAPLAAPPPAHAVFASNPQRNLRWLIEVWGEHILPRVPGAVLHIYGIRDYAFRYDDSWEENERRLGQFIPAGYPDEARRSLRPHAPARREALWDAMRASRVMLTPGHRAEAFCLSVAEAQALGVPAIVRPIAVMPERIRDGVTGFVADDAAAFAQRAIALLTDDALWRRQHEAALALQQGLSWDDVARAFEAEIM